MRGHQPEQTIAYRIYNRGNSFLGIATIELPEEAHMTETLSGSGIMGEIESPTVGLTSSMTVKLSWTNPTHEFYEILDWTESNLYECYISQQHTDPSHHRRDNEPTRINFLGRIKTSSLGSLEQGKKRSNETEFEITRLECYIEGEEKLIIDKLNFIYRVNGADKMQGIRSDIGMSV